MGEKDLNVHDVCNIIESWVSTHLTTFYVYDAGSSKSSCLIAWTKPSSGRLKINTNGSTFSNPCNLSNNTSRHVELEGIRQGLTSAIALDVHIADLKTDCFEDVRIIKDGHYSIHVYDALIEDIRDILNNYGPVILAIIFCRFLLATLKLRFRRPLSEEPQTPAMAAVNGKSFPSLFLWLLLLLPGALAYRPGDIVPMSRMGQYHSSRTVWHDLIGRHCPIFGVNREVLMPIPKPTGYTGADPYKIERYIIDTLITDRLTTGGLLVASYGFGIYLLFASSLKTRKKMQKIRNSLSAPMELRSFQVGREKFLIPWLLVINRKSTEVPMIDVNLRYSGSDLHGVTAKVVDMPHHYIEIHPEIRKQFWDPQHWPKHVLVRYTWKEYSEIDVTSGFFVLFGSGLAMSFVLAIYILQSSRDKLERFVRETVAESSMPGVGVAKVE
ncbi:uncharacterized protein G2W53_016593 [Senna tora]|uniref:Uncharacterized protein n=1 Tax=Senna tora TaxID=362788 RepID=A0A834TPN9_9FABA|nr:uncharacterized protein G2W53_016593 [Senna tora]